MEAYKMKDKLKLHFCVIAESISISIFLVLENEKALTNICGNDVKTNQNYIWFCQTLYWYTSVKIILSPCSNMLQYCLVRPRHRSSPWWGKIRAEWEYQGILKLTKRQISCMWWSGKITSKSVSEKSVAGTSARPALYSRENSVISLHPSMEGLELTLIIYCQSLISVVIISPFKVIKNKQWYLFLNQCQQWSQTFSKFGEFLGMKTL